MRPKHRRNRHNASPLLGARAIHVARAALEELDEGEVGRHLGITQIGKNIATHRFAATVPGYQGWEWNVVVACAAGSSWITVSELALVPGGNALKAPEWVPYHQRVLPGDLGPGDVMPPHADDQRLTNNPADAVFGAVSTTDQVPAAKDPEGDTKQDTADAASVKLLSRYGLEQAQQRWRSGDYGPNSPFAKKAALNCNSCAFYIPLVAPVGPDFGACVNEYSADETVVTKDYGCGAHSETPPVEPLGRSDAQPYDDESIVEVQFEQPSY